MYVESVFATVLGLATLTLLRRFEDRGIKLSRRRLSLTIDSARSSMTAIVECLVKLGATVKQEDYERLVDAGQIRATLEVRLPATIETQAVIDALERNDGLRALKLQQL
jgi:uncharacterized membrane protein YhiD involved in acid resistance